MKFIYLFKMLISALSGVASFALFSYFFNPFSNHAEAVIITGTSGCVVCAVTYCLFFTPSKSKKETK